MNRELTEAEAHLLETAPVLAISGWSGCGKTTALTEIIRTLTDEGLRVAVVKNDAHGGDPDRPGSDTELMGRAGAFRTVLRAPEQQVQRAQNGTVRLATTVLDLLSRSDLVLLEGFKSEPVAKVWLEHPARPELADDIPGIVAVLPWSDDRVRRLLQIVRTRLVDTWRRRPVYGGILIGGLSRRMGQPKQLLTHAGRTFYERVADPLRTVADRIVALGAGPLPPDVNDPQLPDTVNAHGPLAGILSALRWAPDAAWLIAACDLPQLSVEALQWILSQRAPGRWAILPKLSVTGPAEPLLAMYEPQARAALEGLGRRSVFAPRRLLPMIPVATPCPPHHLHTAWRNINTLQELAAIER